MGEWISVDDELPKNMAYVLATEGEEIYILQFRQTTDKRHKKRKGRFDNLYDDFLFVDITHWMELPALPQDRNSKND